MPDDARRDASGSSSGPDALGDLLRGVTRQAGLNRSKPVHPVFSAWAEAAGPALAEVAKPVRFRAGELAVDVASASHHHELVAFTGEPLRRRLNELLGEDLVRRIAFKHNTHE
ncbi:MAG: DUF721 domain-containing protein [Planctomycetota bacterium]